MNDTITQSRLSLRLERYLDDFKRKNPGKEHPFREEWETVWNAAEAARLKSILTPELVDDVRIVVMKL